MFSKYVLFKKGHRNKRAGVWTPPWIRHCNHTWLRAIEADIGRPLNIGSSYTRGSRVEQYFNEVLSGENAEWTSLITASSSSLSSSSSSSSLLLAFDCEYGYWNVSYTSIVLWVETIRLQYLVRRGAGCRAVLVCVTNGITSRYISQLGN